MAKQRQRPAREERAGNEITGRLERRAQMMQAFTDRPDQLLDPNQVGQITHLPPDLAKSILVALEASGWLQPGRTPLGHPGWRRPASNGNGDGHRSGQEDGQPAGDRPGDGNGDQPQPLRALSRPRRPGPGDDFYCRRCHRAETSPVPPAGWFRVQQRDRGAEQPGDRIWFTRGLYCSLAFRANAHGLRTPGARPAGDAVTV